MLLFDLATSFIRKKEFNTVSSQKKNLKRASFKCWMESWKQQKALSKRKLHTSWNFWFSARNNSNVYFFPEKKYKEPLNAFNLVWFKINKEKLCVECFYSGSSRRTNILILQMCKKKNWNWAAVCFCTMSRWPRFKVVHKRESVTCVSNCLSLTNWLPM